jgi:hypothetical protein
MREVTSLPELQDALRVLELPGIALFMRAEQIIPEHGHYTNSEGSMEEWSLTWAKVDGETEVID